jgi:hypothetical protein
MSNPLLARLAKIESALTPERRSFITYRTVVIDEPEQQEIAPAELERLKAKGYRPGVDELVVILEFP